MTTNRSRAGSPHWLLSSFRGRAKPPGLALVGLALVGLIQAGCKSDGCGGGCGGFGSKLTNGVQALGAKVTDHFHKKGSGAGGADCGCGEGGGIVDSGVPVMAPGAMVMPGGGTVIQSPGTAYDSTPTDLKPIPSEPATGAGASGSNTTRSTPGGNSRSSYEASLPRGRTARRSNSDLARAIHPTPPPADPPPADSSDILGQIPPVDLPSEVGRKAVAAPSPTVAPAPVPAAVPEAAPAVPTNTTAAETSSAAEGGATIPPSVAAVRQSPGIRRSASVAPTIGGGTAPAAEGLDWLKEKGYRTFVDLRRGAEVDPNFAEAVNDRGMVYISLPIVSSRLEPARLARFDDLIARSENRPLYFCDADGSRAGLAWYLHLRTVEGDDAQSAAAKAEELGLTSADRKLADSYLEVHKPRPRVALAPISPQAEPNPEPPLTLPAEPPPAPEAKTVPVDSPPIPILPGEDRPEASLAAATKPSKPGRELPSWRPAVALILAGLGVPLAYWSRSAFNEARTARRASLPASARRSLAPPPGSDA